MSKESELRTLTLRELITKHNQLYYNEPDSPLNVSDDEYDSWKREYRTLVPADDPLLVQVGAEPAGAHLSEAPHDFFMGSLNNAMTEQEFRDWHHSTGATAYVIEDKLDGLSIDLRYVNGKLVQALTRGNGLIGQDVTQNALRFQQVPHHFNGFTGSVRGEAVLHKSDWKILDPDEKSNPRNLAAGICRRESGENAECLHFYAFDVIGGFYASTETMAMDVLRINGFTTPPIYFVQGNHDGLAMEIINYHARYGITRDDLPYMIDGLVVKANDKELQKRLGEASGCPKGQIAFKWAALPQKTKLKSIHWEVGHTGVLSPVAELEPVRVGGVTVTSALLCNPDELERLRVRPGDDVMVARMGDVIPKIVSVLHSDGDVPLQLPATCPVCDGPVGHMKNSDGSESVNIYCMNGECDAQTVGKVRRWIKSLEIDGIGDEILAVLTEERTYGPAVDFPGDVEGDTCREGTCGTYRIVSTPADLYRLHKYHDLPNLKINGKSLGKKRAARILEEINKTRELTIDQFLGSLGVKHLGKRRVELIRKADRVIELGTADYTRPGLDYERRHLDDVHNWLRPVSVLEDLTTGEKVEVLGVSYLNSGAEALGIPNIAAEIQAGLDAKRPLIEDLLRYITIKEPTPMKASTTTESVLTGKSFCFTGVRMTAEEATRLAQLGGEEKSGVSKGLTYLVMKDVTKTSNKSKKAAEVGTQVISYADFQEMIK